MASFEDILNTYNCFPYTTCGNSMWPLLKEGKDIVFISNKVDTIRLYDIVLTRRPSGRLLLHRVIGVAHNGTYTICGDNSYKRDTGIRRCEIVGKLEYIIRNEKRNDLNSNLYKTLIYIWCHFFFIRKPVLKIVKTAKL